MRHIITHQRSFWLACLILLGAAFLRYSDAPRLPWGVSTEEISMATLVNQVRGGNISLFVRSPYGESELLYPAGLALVSTLFGDGVLVYRWLAMSVGMLSIALIFTFSVRLYGRLAGLVAAGFMAFSFFPMLLSRLFVIEMILPLLSTVVLLALARALPVYRRPHHPIAKHIVVYATLGAILGMMFYVHPLSLALGGVAMSFIVYSVLVNRPLPRQTLSFLGFAILIMLIVSIPYLLTSLRSAQFAAGRLIGDYQSLTSALERGIAGLFWRGDANPSYNLPLQPLYDPLSGALALLGIFAVLRDRQQPRAVLLLLAFGLLAPFAFLKTGMLSYAVLLPLLALFVGIGARFLLRFVSWRWRNLAILAYALLLAGKALLSAQDLQTWRNLPAVASLYNTRAGQLAHYIDTHAYGIPTSICYGGFSENAPSSAISLTQITLFLVNATSAPLRLIDCHTSLLFVEGGATQALILPNEQSLERMSPYLRTWLDQAQVLQSPDLPPLGVYRFEVGQSLAQTLGSLQTTTPAQYPPEATSEGGKLVSPPIRFGGNLTWMGYMRADERYQAGEVVEVVNFWRVDGALPADLMLFTHVLSDPVTIASQRDLLGVIPSQLNERDIFIQATPILLSPTLLAGDYTVSIGAYQNSTEARLPIFDEQQVRRGDRLLLYAIRIE